MSFITRLGEWLRKVSKSFMGASVDGRTITLTKHNGDTITLITQDTTYNDATQTSAGLMSAQDKTALDNVSLTYVAKIGDTITGELKSTYGNNAVGVYNHFSGVMAGTDIWAIRAGATASDSGYLEIATGDNGTEPIYVSQYQGIKDFTTLSNRATLLDAQGNTVFPGQVSAHHFYVDLSADNLNHGEQQALFQVRYWNQARTFFFNDFPLMAIGVNTGENGNNSAIRLGSNAGSVYITSGENGRTFTEQMPQLLNNENIYLMSDGAVLLYTNIAADWSSYAGPITFYNNTVTAQTFIGDLNGIADSALNIQSYANPANKIYFDWNGQSANQVGLKVDNTNMGYVLTSAKYLHFIQDYQLGPVGYFKFASGQAIQWGATSISATSAVAPDGSFTGAITFPIPFTAAGNYIIFFTVAGGIPVILTQANRGDGSYATVQIVNKSTSNITSRTVNWFAIGRWK